MIYDWRTYAVGSAVFAALTAVLGKVAVSSINSNLATFIRTIVILIFTAGILFWRGQWKDLPSISTRTFTFLVLSGLATGISWLCYYRALQLGPVSKVAPVDKLGVALAILMGIFILGEKADVKTLIGGALVVVGAVLLAS